MLTPAITRPLRYDPSFENPEEDERETCEEIVETMREISRVVDRDEGHAYRSVHAKSHGLLLGTLTVLENLSEVYAQGAFAVPGAFPVVMRLSTVPGDVLDDAVSTPRGLAVKIVGIEGERQAGTETDVTQDFVLVNAPAFGAPTAKKFLGGLKLVAATTGKAPGMKKALSAALRGIESLVEKAGGESAMLEAMSGHPVTNPLGETYFSQVPLLYGPYMAKVAIAPISPELTSLTDAPVDLRGRPDGLRDAMVEHFRALGGTWELRVQLCTDLGTMPIEDASVEWPEEQSPYIAVARIAVAPQSAWSPARSAAVDDRMSFSPWHALAAHRPIGSIMRVRKAAYEMSSTFRSKRNAVSVAEPKTLESLPP